MSFEKDISENCIDNTRSMRLELEYDDRFSLKDLISDYVIVSVSDIRTDSFQVADGKPCEKADEHVIRIEEGSSCEIRACAVGQALMVIAPAGYASGKEASLQAEGGSYVTDMPPSGFNAHPGLPGSECSTAGRLQKYPCNLSDTESEAEGCAESEIIYVYVYVKPAVLTRLIIAGQSNAEGYCPRDIGYELSESVACIPGSVYSTYAPASVRYGNKIADKNFSAACWTLNAKDFIAQSLTSPLSLSGKPLEYPLNTLCEGGGGKTGPDSGLGYEWNRLSGEKVWVINVSGAGTPIENWKKGAVLYERIRTCAGLAQQVCEAEVKAGHFVMGKVILFWLQGEVDKKISPQKYYSAFNSICRNLKADLKLDALGIISVRSNAGDLTNPDELYMTSPRISQYIAAQRRKNPFVYMASNVNEFWLCDEGVRNYYESRYPQGHITYPVQGGVSKYASSLPVCVREVHTDAHYCQSEHNENGISAAEGIYSALYRKPENLSVKWRRRDGLEINSLILGVNEEAYLIAAVQPAYFSKAVTYKIGSNKISYNPDTAVIKGCEKGITNVRAYQGKKLISQLDIIVVENPSNGLCYDAAQGWRYYTNSDVDVNFKGLAKNIYGWWYVRNGRIDFSFTGLAIRNFVWYYVKNGRVIPGYTGLADNFYGTWYLKKGKLAKEYNGMVEFEGELYFVECGCVNRINGLKHCDGSWYYLKDGKVASDFCGLAENENGRWYVENGRVDLKYTGEVEIDGIIYDVRGSKIRKSRPRT